MYLQSCAGDLQEIHIAAQLLLLHFHVLQGPEAAAVQLNQAMHAIEHGHSVQVRATGRLGPKWREA